MSATVALEQQFRRSHRTSEERRAIVAAPVRSR
jgi:hypothetical protein